MKKKIIIGVVAVSVIIVSCFFLFHKESDQAKITELMDDMNTYSLTGNMEILKGEETKTYAIEVGYKKKGKKDYFKVDITDKELNQTQVILRNKDGVFVVTPTLNQTFKFEGDWPLNSLKPYLIQSMVKIAQDEACETNSENDEIYLKSNVNYPNNANFKVQEMYFDTDGKIKKLQILDDNDIIQLKINFTKVKYNNKLKDTYFDIPEDINSEASSSVVTSEDLPLYPMNIFDSTLDSSSTIEVNGGTRHILNYKGDKNFTLIETIKAKSDSTQTVIMSGEFVDNITDFGFYDGNHLTILSNEIEYTIYSDDLNVDEMIEVLNSVQVVVMK